MLETLATTPLRSGYQAVLGAPGARRIGSHDPTQRRNHQRRSTRRTRPTSPRKKRFGPCQRFTPARHRLMSQRYAECIQTTNDSEKMKLAAMIVAEEAVALDVDEGDAQLSTDAGNTTIDDTDSASMLYYNSNTNDDVHIEFLRLHPRVRP